MLIGAKPALPEVVTNHGYRALKRRLAFLVEERAAESAGASEKGEVIVGNEQPVDSFDVVIVQVQAGVGRSDKT
jgi:hypothetical protein